MIKHELLKEKKTSIMIYFYFVFIGLSVIFSYTIGIFDLLQLIIILGSTFGVVFVCLYFSLSFSNTEQEKMTDETLDKIRDVSDEMLGKMLGIMKLAEGKMIINNDLLQFFEKQADLIWVVTKTLENDIKDDSIRKAVEDNLANGKEYRYFIPDIDSIRRNKLAYEKIYKKYIDNVTFTILPKETLFMFNEVVIYNPTDPGFDRTLAYTYVDILEGPDQVVQIGKENVKAILNNLYDFIKPTYEKQQKLFGIVRDLREKIDLDTKNTSYLLNVILNEEFTKFEQKDFEEKLKKDGYVGDKLYEIQNVMKQIAHELETTDSNRR